MDDGREPPTLCSVLFFAFPHRLRADFLLGVFVLNVLVGSPTIQVLTHLLLKMHRLTRILRVTQDRHVSRLSNGLAVICVRTTIERSTRHGT
jgi:hypothetical protein